MLVVETTSFSIWGNPVIMEKDFLQSVSYTDCYNYFIYYCIML